MESSSGESSEREAEYKVKEAAAVVSWLKPPQIYEKSYKYNLLHSLHDSLPSPGDGETYLCRGDWLYFHYGCDGVNDEGWGCGYRSLQSICSWILCKYQKDDTPIPSISEIQTTLVQIGDKSASFKGSKEWIGAMEVCFVLETLYNVNSKILHFPRGKNLDNMKKDLVDYFEKTGGLIMMGGDADNSSKIIAGVHICKKGIYLLIVDPHFTGQPDSPEDLIKNGYFRWDNTRKFPPSSFYNLCLPQLFDKEK